MTISGSTYILLQNEILSHQLSDTKYRPLVQQWLNEAQRFIVLQADLRTQAAEDTYTTVADDGSLTLPTDFARLISLFDTDNREQVYPIDLRAFDDAALSTGKPTNYVITGNTINLYPTPDQAYNLSIRYWKLPQDMENDGDEPEIPIHYRHLLVRYCLVRAFERENDYEAANYWRDQFETGLMKLRSQAQYDTHDGPRQVPGLWEDAWVDPNAWR